MSCILRVSGTEFDVDEYLSKTDWKNYKLNIYYKGDKHTIRSLGISQCSGFSICVSDADFADFGNQQKDAIAFLKEFENNFSLLKAYILDCARGLDFGLETYPKNQFSKTHFISTELALLAGNAGMDIVMSNYFTKNEQYLKRKRKRRWSIRK